MKLSRSMRLQELQMLAERRILILEIRGHLFALVEKGFGEDAPNVIAAIREQKYCSVKRCFGVNLR